MKTNGQENAGSIKKDFPEAYIGEFAALQQLDQLSRKMEEKSKTFIGYPCNARLRLENFFKWWEHSVVSKLPLNDVGDPQIQVETLYSLSTHDFESRVLHFFADLFSIHPYWGYITSGGTQGDEQGLYMGRQVLSEYGQPVLYFSEDAHYSIASLGRVLGIECCVIASQPSGEMDYEDLAQKLRADRPVLVSVSIGTTFKGAIDRIEVIDRVIKEKGIEHVYYHTDAALFGGYLPFYPDPRVPDLNFAKYPYDSITISGHKFFGSPIPLGIFLIREEHTHALEAEYIEYIHSPNLTIPCSRSSLNTLIFWWMITTTPLEEFSREAVFVVEHAQYLYEQLKERNYPVWLNPFSNTVYFKAPSFKLCKRWALSRMTYRDLGSLAHVVVMQHVDKAILDQFLQELDQDIQLQAA